MNSGCSKPPRFFFLIGYVLVSILNGLFTISPLFLRKMFSHLYKHKYNQIYHTYIHIRIWSFHHPFGFENYEMCISEDLYLNDCNYPPSKSIQIYHESTQLDITRESLMWNHSYEDSKTFQSYLTYQLLVVASDFNHVDVILYLGKQFHFVVTLYGFQWVETTWGVHQYGQVYHAGSTSTA